MMISISLMLQAPIVCTKDGLWTEEFKLCDDLQGECLPPQELNLVEYKCELGYGIGKSADFGSFFSPYRYHYHPLKHF